MQHPIDKDSNFIFRVAFSLSFCSSLASTWLVSGLILVGEPYYNEAGYERQRGTQQGLEASI